MLCFNQRDRENVLETVNLLNLVHVQKKILQTGLLLSLFVKGYRRNEIFLGFHINAVTVIQYL